MSAAGASSQRKAPRTTSGPSSPDVEPGIEGKEGKAEADTHLLQDKIRKQELALFVTKVCHQQASQRARRGYAHSVAAPTPLIKPA
jgi:hypothetical protein